MPPSATPRSCLVVSPRLPPAVGGGESFGELLITALAAVGRRVSVFTSAPVADDLHEVVRGSGGVLHLPRTVEDNRSPWERATFERSEQVHTILARDDPDEVFCLSHDAAIAVALALGGDPATHPAVVGSYVDTSVLRTPLGPGRARFVYSLDAVGAILAESRFYASVALDHGVPAERIVMASAVDVARFSTADPARGRHLAGVDRGRRVILCASRFTPRKRIEDLVRAMAALAPEFPDAVLVIAGSAQSGSTGYQADVVDLVERSGIAARCRVLTDLDRRDISDVTAAGTLAVQTSEFEGLGRSVLEAMAAGVPVVVTRTTGFDEIVAPGRTGLTYPVGDVDALTSAIRLLFEDQALARDLIANASRWVGQTMSIDALGRSAIQACELADAHRHQHRKAHPCARYSPPTSSPSTASPTPGSTIPTTPPPARSSSPRHGDTPASG